MARKRTGCIYVEVQRNTGKSNNGGGLYQPRYIRGVGRRDCGRLRYVGEISYHGKRYRFRSTNYSNVDSWMKRMTIRFSD